MKGERERGEEKRKGGGLPGPRYGANEAIGPALKSG